MADTIKNIKRFEAAYDELKEKLWLVRNLSEQGIGYEKLAPHLQKDADKRMGIVKWINVPIFADDNEGERNEPPEGWKLVPVEPTEEMLAADFSVTMSMAVNAKHCRQLRYKAMLAAAPTPPAQLGALPPDVLNALRFYANGEHFNIDSEAQEFDTVSGEPDNWLHSQRDEDCTMIEDGSVARAVLQGKTIHGDMDSQPVEGEVYGIAPPAQEDEPVGELVKFGDGPWGEIYKSYVNIPAGTKLYTHPQSDELRKAAEELLPILQKAVFASEVCDFDQNAMMDATIKLRAALEGK